MILVTILIIIQVITPTTNSSFISTILIIISTILVSASILVGTNEVVEGPWLAAVPPHYTLIILPPPRILTRRNLECAECLKCDHHCCFLYKSPGCIGMVWFRKTTAHQTLRQATDLQAIQDLECSEAHMQYSILNLKKGSGRELQKKQEYKTASDFNTSPPFAVSLRLNIDCKLKRRTKDQQQRSGW